MTRAELLAALAAATGPDRALDFWLWWYCKANVANPDKPPPADYVADNLHTAPRYTASLDAALTLVPENCGWSVGLSHAGFTAEVMDYDTGAQFIAGEPGIATPAHALSIAALSAGAP